MWAWWIRERLRDALMWPLNLVRDFPVRFRRLVQTLRRGWAGAWHLAPAARQQRLGLWLRQSAGETANWVHLLVVQVFDLAGGPEIAQFFMHLLTHTTPLTPAERAAISAILGSKGLRYGEVRVAEGGLFDLVFKVNGNLAFTTWHTINFPRSGHHTRANLAILIHELTHVYQYEQVGSRYLGEAIYKLVTTRRNCYAYGAAAGLQAAQAKGEGYRDFNREQQAQIVQDYYTLCQKGEDVSAYEPFIAQARAGDV